MSNPTTNTFGRLTGLSMAFGLTRAGIDVRQANSTQEQALAMKGVAADATAEALTRFKPGSTMAKFMPFVGKAATAFDGAKAMKTFYEEGLKDNPNQTIMRQAAFDIVTNAVDFVAPLPFGTMASVAKDGVTFAMKNPQIFTPMPMDNAQKYSPF